MSENIGPRPQTTCGFREKTARKPHRCRDCQARIEPGEKYTQDDYYAPFGNGARYCQDCANERAEAESRWELQWKLGHGQD